LKKRLACPQVQFGLQPDCYVAWGKIRMDKTKEFFVAIRSGDAVTVRAMLDAEPELASSKNEHGQSPVLAAVYGGRTEIRDALIARGGALECHEAAAAGHLERVKQLVERNPELAKSNSPDGFPVFALAAAFGQLPVARYLFEKGADVNAAATNGTGYNALTGAVTGGHTELAAWLLEKGADPNYRYGPGYTPLIAAAANGHLEIVKSLLVHGADVHAKTNDGKSTLAIAEERKHPEVAAYLRTKGAA
jgi:ankyrin repeat protein